MNNLNKKHFADSWKKKNEILIENDAVSTKETCESISLLIFLLNFSKYSKANLSG